MKNCLLLLILIFFSTGLFSQPPCGNNDSIVIIEEKDKPNPEIATVAFETTSKTRYAFDLYRDIYARVPEYFLKYKPSTNDMIASAKFIVAGESDEIFVRIKNRKADFDPQKVRFLTGNGKEYKGGYNAVENGWTLTLIGGNAGDGQEVYVVYETEPGKVATLDIPPVRRSIHVSVAQPQKELERLLSTEYRTKIKEQLQEWVIENVNFEE